MTRGNNGRRRGAGNSSNVEHHYEEITQEDCEAHEEEDDDDDDHNMSNRQRYMHTNLGNLYSHSSTSNNNNSSSSTSLSFNKIILILLIFTSIFGVIYYGLSKEEVRKMHEMEVREHEEVERLKLKYGLVEKSGGDDGEKSDGVEGGDMTDSFTSAADVSAVVKDEGKDNKIDNNKAPQSEKKSSEKGEYELLSSDMDELRSIIQELRTEIKSLQSQSAEIGELRNKTSALLEELEGEKLKVSELEKAVRSVSSSLPQSLPVAANGGEGRVRRRHN
jgi:hypothetical protein